MMTVAVLGYNRKCSQRALYDVLRNGLFDTSRLVSVNKRRAELDDNTEYIVIGDTNDIMGRRIDQLLIVDDERMLVLDKRAEDIQRIMPCLFRSSVSTDLQVQKIVIPFEDNGIACHRKPYMFGKELCFLCEYNRKIDKP